MAKLHYIVVAAPKSKRWHMYHETLIAFTKSIKSKLDLTLIDWVDLIQADGDLSKFTLPTEPAIMRVDTPSRDFDVRKNLLAAGARERGDADPEQWLDLEPDKGRMFAPGLRFDGLKRTLTGLQASVDQLQDVFCPTPPKQCISMFDKNITSEKLRAAGISTPDSFRPTGDAKQLLQKLNEVGFEPAFVKLASGSSAAGIAIVYAASSEPYAITTLVRIGEHFYSTRKLQEIRGEILLDTLQFLLDEGATVQQGIALAQLNDQNFDVRVIVIHGEPAFFIFRLSSAPMTNLHLGGIRGNQERCLKEIPNQAWQDGLDSCVQAANCFDAGLVGVDLAFDRDYQRHYILEVNAFGDFFPGYVDVQGRTIPRIEIEKTHKQFSLSLI